MLPILISIPHGGNKIPEEIKERVCLSKYDQFIEEDAYAREIFNISNLVESVLSTEISSAFIDFNQSKKNLPPKNENGLVKIKTRSGKKIYCDHLEPDSVLINQLIEKYYDPFHRKLSRIIKEKGIKIGLDCHSMLSMAPEIAPDPESERPLITISNREGETCDYEILERLADCLQVNFNVDDIDLAINKPFKGGYIIKKYGNKLIPFIQVELNRKLYLDDPWFDPVTLEVQEQRIKELNQKFHDAIELFAKVVLNRI